MILIYFVPLYMMLPTYWFYYYFLEVFYFLTSIIVYILLLLLYPQVDERFVEISICPKSRNQ